MFSGNNQTHANNDLIAKYDKPERKLLNKASHLFGLTDRVMQIIFAYKNVRVFDLNLKFYIDAVWLFTIQFFLFKLFTPTPKPYFVKISIVVM